MQNNTLINKKHLKHGMVVTPTVGGRIADTILIIIALTAAFVCIIPMWHVLMASISDGKELIGNSGLLVLPIGKVSFKGYQLLFAEPDMISGYVNTLVYVVGTIAFGTVINVLGGYAISRKTKMQTVMTVVIVFTMMFGGGMIPTYMIMHSLNLTDSRFVVILLDATMAMYVIMSANAFRSVPESTVESARLDGAGHFRIMFQIMLPQCMSIFVVTIIYTFVGAWNSWLTAKIYVPYDTSKHPLLLIINTINANHTSSSVLRESNPDYARLTIQHAVVIAATLPMFIAFPFFQKKLEAGVIGGAVKG